MFSPTTADLPAEPLPELDPSLFQHPASWAFWMVTSAFWLLYLVYFAFWIWMLIECVRKDPDRYFWMWMLVLVAFPGALIYFFVRWLPGRDLRLPKSLRRFARGKELTRLEIAAQQIGNPHQLVQLGDALRDVGQTERAGQAYRDALQKEPKNTQALWGAALVEMDRRRYQPAAELLQTLLAIDPQYKFGDVSLAYGKSLYELGRADDALQHLQQHARRWRQPEALYLIATLQADRGNVREARTQLQELLLDINGSPTAIARKQAPWKSRAHKLLKQLPRA